MLDKWKQMFFGRETAVQYREAVVAGGGMVGLLSTKLTQLK